MSTLYQIEARVQAALHGPGPRPDTHTPLAPRPRSGWRAGVIPAESRAAAALVLLYPIGPRVHLVLTRRAGTLDQHAGQVSLPGGAVDAHETIEAAALREAREEIGLETNDLRITGRLTPLYIPVSNYALYPVVAVSDRRPALVPATAEVAHILEIPLDELLDPDRVRLGRRWRGDQAITVPYFELHGERVWGATAMVLGELVHLMRSNSKGDRRQEAGDRRSRKASPSSS